MKTGEPARGALGLRKSILMARTDAPHRLPAQADDGYEHSDRNRPIERVTEIDDLPREKPQLRVSG